MPPSSFADQERGQFIDGLLALTGDILVDAGLIHPRHDHLCLRQRVKRMDERDAGIADQPRGLAQP